jgi:hypothetical protein
VGGGGRPPSSPTGTKGGEGPLEGVGPKNRDFSGPEMAPSETHVNKITNVLVPVFYMALGLNNFDAGKSITKAIGRDLPSLK